MSSDEHIGGDSGEGPGGGSTGGGGGAGGAAGLGGEGQPAPLNPPEWEGEPARPIDWRRRALAAEARVEQLIDELSTAQRQAAELRAAVDAVERRARIERELTRAEAVDLETATLMTEAALASMDAPDVARAVADLRRRKPFLFAASAGGSGSMPARPAPGGPGLGDMAEEARQSGDQRLLLRYLRAKRGA